LSPETRQRSYPLPRYHPQRIAVPSESRAPYCAALLGVLVVFSAFGLFAGLAGTILRESLHRQSLALAGATVFITLGASVSVQVTVGSWPIRPLATWGVAAIILGLTMVIAAVWLPSPSLPLFLTGDAIAAGGGGAVFRGALDVVTAVARPNARAEALAGFFLAGYIGLSGPVLGIGIALPHISVRVTLLAFALAIGIGAFAALPILIRPSGQR
jgi:hypothetical protein